VIGSCGFGTDFQSLQASFTDQPSAYQAASNTLLEAQILIVFLPSWLRDIAWPRRQVTRSKKVFLDGVRQLRARYHANKSEFPGEKAMISELLRVEETGQFNGDEVDDTIMTMLIAGHETTANTVCWALYYLSFDRAMQDRVKREADEAGELGYAALPNLQFTKVCDVHLRP
jgi:cytochrome P450